MSIARVQEKNAVGTKNVGATWPVATTAGNLLVAVVSGANTAETSTTTFAAPTGWQTAAGPIQSEYGVVYIFYLPNAASQTATGNFVNSNGSTKAATALVVAEYSGVATSSPLDQSASHADPTNAASASGSTGTTATTAAADELLIGVLGTDNAIATFSSPTNSFTLVDQAAGAGGTTAVCLLERIVAATGAYSSGATLSASVASNGAIASFEGAGSAPTAPIFLTPGSPTANSVPFTWTLTDPSTTDVQLWYNTANSFGTASEVDLGSVASMGTVTGLTAATSYYFWVTASNSYGTSSPAGPATASTLGAVVPPDERQGAVPGSSLALQGYRFLYRIAARLLWAAWPFWQMLCGGGRDAALPAV